MIVYIKIQSILAGILDLPKIDGSTELEISIPPGTSLLGLFEQLTLQYPGFKSLTDPKNNRLNDLLIVVNEVVVVSTELDQIALKDQSNITLLARYKGG
jgi:hypothetical protein